MSAAAWRSALEAALPQRVSFSESDRATHGRDPAHALGAPPEAVAYPVSTQEVQALVLACAAHGRPVIPFGAGTSLEGHVSAPQGGLCLDMSRMNQVLAVSAGDLDARVEAGVTREQLNTHLRDLGLMFPIDPGANATLGGMAATRASGTTAVKYGTMRAAVLGLTVVTAQGEVIEVGGRARKSSAGYDLTGLFVGSEGTLGVITEVQVRLHPIPEAIAAATAAFPDLRACVDCVIALLQAGTPLARIELLDTLLVHAVNRRAGLGLEEKPTLFLEFHGGPAAVQEQCAFVGEIASAYGGGPFLWAERVEDRSRLWKARHEAFWAGQDLRPGADVMISDVCVPISRLADCLIATREDLDARGLLAPIVGHVGDGNFHCLILHDGQDPREVALAHAANDAIVARALAMGGTCTGEHGIGLGKQGFLAAEHGASLGLMRAVKAALDPQGLMNPGKIFAPLEAVT
jgi:D-lactate dehydrogenase (cytochrome)